MILTLLIPNNCLDIEYCNWSYHLIVTTMINKRHKVNLIFFGLKHRRLKIPIVLCVVALGNTIFNREKTQLILQNN